MVTLGLPFHSAQYAYGQVFLIISVSQSTNLCMSLFLFQDDLHIVNSLEIPTDDPKYVEDLVENRNWGPSVLLVDE